MPSSSTAVRQQRLKVCWCWQITLYKPEVQPLLPADRLVPCQLFEVAAKTLQLDANIRSFRLSYFAVHEVTFLWSEQQGFCGSQHRDGHMTLCAMHQWLSRARLSTPVEPDEVPDGQQRTLAACLEKASAEAAGFSIPVCCRFP
jgi:hypothetical protein